MKRLPVFCLLMLLTLGLTATAFAAPSAASERPRAQVASALDRADRLPEARNDAPAANVADSAKQAKKALPADREISANAASGGGGGGGWSYCVEYVIFGYWHYWSCE